MMDKLFLSLGPVYSIESIGAAADQWLHVLVTMRAFKKVKSDTD